MPASGSRCRARPQVSNEDIKTDVGLVPTTTAVVELGTTVAFVVMHSSYTEKQLTGRTPERILDGARDGSARGRSCGPSKN